MLELAGKTIKIVVLTVFLILKEQERHGRYFRNQTSGDEDFSV